MKKLVKILKNNDDGLAINDNIKKEKFIGYVISHVQNKKSEVPWLRYNNYLFFRCEFCQISSSITRKTQMIESIRKKSPYLIEEKIRKLVSKCKNFLAL